MYDIVLFDLDGTLTRSEFGIVNAIMYALSKLNITLDDKSILKKFIGPPLVKSFMKYFDFTEDRAKEAVAYCQEYMREKGVYEAPLYDGIREVLEALFQEGKRVFIATSKPEVFANQIVKHLKIEDFFEGIVGANLDGTQTDKAEVIKLLLEKYAITEKSKVVMVGDREHDILGAISNNIDSVGVLYGYGERAELVSAGATHIIERPAELPDIIKMREKFAGEL